MRRKKEEEEEFNESPQELPAPFDDQKFVDPILVVKRGMAIMMNEVGRMSTRSASSGLSPMEAAVLSTYVKTASDVAKKHKSLQIGYLTPELLNSMTSEAYFNIAKEIVRDMPEEYKDEKKAFHFMDRNKKKAEYAD